MNYRPLVTMALVLTSLIVTLVAPIFDSSFYGVNGHPTEWLSFSPDAPLRHYGLSLIFSPFLHISFLHLLTNMVVFMPVAMMIERKKSGSNLILRFLFIHFKVLIILVIVNALFPLGGKAFLGSSHVVVGLYTFWALNQKKYGMLLVPLLVLGIGLWDFSSLTFLAHILGFLVGVGLFFLGSLLSKLRLKSSN